jgi:hypothetical protein
VRSVEVAERGEHSFDDCSTSVHVEFAHILASVAVGGRKPKNLVEKNKDRKKHSAVISLLRHQERKSALARDGIAARMSKSVK